jgi:hypothetical protein
MHPDAAEEFIRQSELKEKLIQEGKLPDIIGLHERLAYIGHTLIYSIWQPDKDKIHRCVICMVDWQGSPSTCPFCFQEHSVYQLNIERRAHWECVKCQHQWTSENGYECPKCGALENAPRWTCSGCQHHWIGVDSHCPQCGKNYY